MSIARVEEMMRDERPGAVRLARVINERPRYINLVVLLRIACEITATALLVDFLYEHLGLDWGLIAAAAIMVVISFVLIGVGSPNPRQAARVLDRTRRCASAAGDFGAADTDQPTARPHR